MDYFQFNRKFYQQVRGMPMGSPISGLIAEATLRRIEAIVFHTFTPKLWERYVNDRFVIKDMDRLSDFLRPP